MKKFLIWFLPGLILGAMLILGGGKAITMTSTNEYCISCHIHPKADASWKKSVHYETKSGVHVACVDCHLPPKGQGYLWAKSTTGMRDLWSKWTKNAASFNFDARRNLEAAHGYVYESSCVKCHENLFPSKLTKDGENAHLYYTQNKDSKDLSCINCHLNAGHLMEGYTHGSNSTFGSTSSEPKKLFIEPSRVTEFKNYTENIPKSAVSFNMVAIPGGTFEMGSPANEPFRKEDEGPVKKVEISPFYMAEIEVTWDEYLTFYAQTATSERTADIKVLKGDSSSKVDAISGATPPYGQPDQNWGLGQRPAITMSYHSAETYCKWLTFVTGKTYRLPTEAEWEYANRAGTNTPYFFPGDPNKFERSGLKARLFKNDTTMINTYVLYRGNSSGKTQTPDNVKPNPFGLKNMAGNVAEFCSDWYAADAYSLLTDGVKDPKGPESGSERVIRGGSFLDQASAVRSASRDFTKNDQWLRTDPQMPKSIWWYSDCFNVGFRVVCEFDQNTGKRDTK